MEVTIEHRDLKLRCEIIKDYPTFEDDILGLLGGFTVESIKLEDSEVDILDLFHEKLDYIKLLISGKL
jgi:hypothetical protein